MGKECRSRKTDSGWLLLVVALTFGVGCSSATDDPPATPAFRPSESLTIAGERWERDPEMTAADRRVLTDYLTTHSSLTEGDAVRGEPTIYRQGERRSRFYWFRTEGTGVAWFCLETQGSRVVPTEGHGVLQ